MTFQTPRINSLFLAIVFSRDIFLFLDITMRKKIKLKKEVSKEKLRKCDNKVFIVIYQALCIVVVIIVGTDF